jgi:HK97 family phage major capsid protein
MNRTDYMAQINNLKAEKKSLMDKADQLIAENKFGEELEGVQKDIQDKAKAIDQLGVQAAMSAQGAEPAEEKQENKTKKHFANLGEQLMAIRNAARGNVDERLLQVNNDVKGAQSKVDEDGGYAIQEDFAKNILETAVTTGQILSRVDTYTISANSNSMRFMTADESDLSGNAVFGGVEMHWAAEGGTVPASKPKFKETKIDLEKMMGFAYATEELLQDAAFMTSYFGTCFTLASERLVEGAIVSGDGNGKPLGILNSDATIAVPAESGQGAGTITAENILAMWQRGLYRNRKSMIWVAHPDCELQFQGMKMNDQNIWMPEGGLADTPYQRILGRPVIYDDNCSALGSKGDVNLWDLQQYMLVKKGSARQDWSMHVEFLTDQMCFRMVLRLNGAPKSNKKIKLKNTNLERSAFVTLAARA